MSKSKSGPPQPTPEEQLAAIDPAALAQVTGGTTDSGALVAQLNSLLDSVKQVTTTSNANGINPQEMMLFMMLMQRQNQSQTVVAAPAATTVPWWSGGTWYY